MWEGIVCATENELKEVRQVIDTKERELSRAEHFALELKQELGEKVLLLASMEKEINCLRAQVADFKDPNLQHALMVSMEHQVSDVTASSSDLANLCSKVTADREAAERAADRARKEADRSADGADRSEDWAYDARSSALHVEISDARASGVAHSFLSRIERLAREEAIEYNPSQRVPNRTGTGRPAILSPYHPRDSDSNR